MKSRLRYENLGLFTQRHTGKETTVVRDRDDYKALVKVRDAQKTAGANGEVVTQKVFPGEMVSVNKVFARTSSICSKVNNRSPAWKYERWETRRVFAGKRAQTKWVVVIILV